MDRRVEIKNCILNVPTVYKCQFKFSLISKKYLNSQIYHRATMNILVKSEIIRQLCITKKKFFFSDVKITFVQ